MTSEPVGNSPRGAIPGNSHKQREAEPVAASQREKVKPEKVIEGKVILRKQPWFKRIAYSMIADDATSIRDYLVVEVVIPAAKNLIHDIVVGGMDRSLYGSSPRDRRGTRIVGGGSLRTRYDQMREERPRDNRESRVRNTLDDIILDSHAEAVDVIENLIVYIDKYGQASVADLYDMLGVSAVGYTDQSWGWRDLRTADVRNHRGGFLLDLPRPEPLR